MPKVQLRHAFPAKVPQQAHCPVKEERVNDLAAGKYAHAALGGLEFARAVLERVYHASPVHQYGETYVLAGNVLLNEKVAPRRSANCGELGGVSAIAGVLRGELASTADFGLVPRFGENRKAERLSDVRVFVTLSKADGSRYRYTQFARDLSGGGFVEDQGDLLRRGTGYLDAFAQHLHVRRETKKSAIRHGNDGIHPVETELVLERSQERSIGALRIGELHIRLNGAGAHRGLPGGGQSNDYRNAFDVERPGYGERGSRIKTKNQGSRARRTHDQGWGSGSTNGGTMTSPRFLQCWNCRA